MRKTILGWVWVVMATLLVNGCDTSSTGEASEAPAPLPIHGSWKFDSTFFMTNTSKGTQFRMLQDDVWLFHPDGTFETEGVSYTESGTYRVAGDSVYITTRNQDKVYHFSFPTKNRLALKVLLTRNEHGTTWKHLFFTRSQASESAAP